jgi:hypothetical protein
MLGRLSVHEGAWAQRTRTKPARTAWRLCRLTVVVAIVSCGSVLAAATPANASCTV